MKGRGPLAAAMALLLVMVLEAPAEAMPRPRSEEWWFPAWGIEKDVWPLTKGVGVTVAVLDTGVNASLPELSGAVLEGTDTTGRTGDGRRDLDDRDGGHGTGISALIAGRGGGSTGFVGIAPDAKILPVHVTSRLGDPVNLYNAVAAGIRFAVDRHSKVINISQGFNAATSPNHCDPEIQRAVADAVDHDVIVVASSGNEGDGANWPDMPASCSGVLAVGAIDRTLRPWPGTQRQPYVAVAAPGTGGVIGKYGQYYPHASGTSISAALTSGAAALIRSRNPHMSARTVVQRLMATTLRTDASPPNEETGYGPIQITSAMNPKRYPLPEGAPNPVYDAFDKWRATQRGTAPPPAKPTAWAQERNTHRTFLGPVLLGGAGALIIVAFSTTVMVRRRRTRSKSACGSGSTSHPGNNQLGEESRG